MSINTTFWLAIDEDGEESIHDVQPEWRFSKIHGYYWYPCGDHNLSLPTGQIKAWGYNLKPGECMQVTGPNYDPSPIQ